jgi:hypothetical protein
VIQIGQNQNLSDRFEWPKTERAAALLPNSLHYYVDPPLRDDLCRVSLVGRSFSRYALDPEPRNQDDFAKRDDFAITEVRRSKGLSTVPSWACV